jgi:hypothetical protein
VLVGAHKSHRHSTPPGKPLTALVLRVARGAAQLSPGSAITVELVRARRRSWIRAAQGSTQTVAEGRGSSRPAAEGGGRCGWVRARCVGGWTGCRGTGKNNWWDLRIEKMKIGDTAAAKCHVNG